MYIVCVSIVKWKFRGISCIGGGGSGLDWSGSGYGHVAGCRKRSIKFSGFRTCGEFLDQLRNFQDGICSLELRVVTWLFGWLEV
jgi:hypothetical protein